MILPPCPDGSEEKKEFLSPASLCPHFLRRSMQGTAIPQAETQTLPRAVPVSSPSAVYIIGEPTPKIVAQLTKRGRPTVRLAGA